MATGRKRKQRQRHTDAVEILNGINRDSPRVARQRRQTAPRADVYDIPVTPQKPTEDRTANEVNSLEDEPQTQDNNRPAQEAGDSDSERGSVSEANEQPDQASASSEHDDNGNDTPEPHENTAEEDLGEPSQGQLSRFSDANEGPSASRERTRSEAPRQRSSPGPESRNQPAVVIHNRRNEHQATGDKRNDQDDNSSNPDDTSLPETLPARPSQSSPPARTLAIEADDDFGVQANEQSAQNGSGYETGHEYQEAHVSSPEPMEELLDQPQNESGVGDRLSEWFKKEIDGSPLEDSWGIFYTEGKGLRRYRSGSMPEYLRESRNLISKMCELYREIEQPAEFSYLQAKQLRNFRGSIFADLKQISNHASEKLEDATVLDQYEAHLIPRMVKLVLLSFRTFKVIGRSAADQLYETLDLVLRCSVRIYDYRKTELLPALARSRVLHRPLKRLKAAFESRIFDARLHVQAGPTQTERQPLQPLTQANIPPSTVPWTQGEVAALVDGLQRFTGNDRFFWIIRCLGDRFRERTVRDLIAKTEEMGYST